MFEAQSLKELQRSLSNGVPLVKVVWALSIVAAVRNT
jgi:hypothetical protein